LVLQTAPLWPRKVPTQSPVHSLSIGLPSLQLEMSKKLPSGRIGEKERWVTGLVWPGATSGVDFGGTDIKSYKMRSLVVICTSAPRCGPREGLYEQVLAGLQIHVAFLITGPFSLLLFGK
jgi:hypothetical protein